MIPLIYFCCGIKNQSETGGKKKTFQHFSGRWSFKVKKPQIVYFGVSIFQGWGVSFSFFPLRLPKGNLYFSIFVCDTHCGKPSTMGPKFPDSTPFLRTQSSDRGLSAKNHFQSYRTKIDFCHSVRLCVLYIRAAAAARDRVAAVVGAWPNIWLRHHQTRYFFFSISLSLWKPEGEKLVWWADPLHRHLIQWWPTLRFKPRRRSSTVFSSIPNTFFFHCYFHKWDFSHDRSDLVFQTSFFPLCISLL